MDTETKEHKSTLRRIFISGLLVLIPIVATIFVLVFLFNLLDGWLAPMGGQVLRIFGFKLPPELKHIPGFGILATFILIFFTGLIASNFLGRKILQFGDRLIKNIPIVSSIYTAMRQVVNSISVTGSTVFKTVVMFEYPRPGIWVIGFLTTPSLSSARKIANQNLVNVFLPTTPNPTSGFFLMIPLQDLHILPISAEDGLKIVATVGLIQKEEIDVPGTDRHGILSAAMTTPTEKLSQAKAPKKKRSHKQRQKQKK